MRILMASHYLSWSGGIERVVMELSTRMAARGHDVHIAASRIGTDVTAGLTPGIRLHPVPTWKWTPATVAQFSLRATGVLRSIDFDIIHSHGAALIKGDVLTAHSCHTHWYHQSVASAHPVGRLRKMLNPLHKVLMAYESRQYSDGHFTGVIAVSDQVAAEIAEHFSYHGAITVIPNGINLQEFSSTNKEVLRRAVRERLALGPDDFVVLFVGNEFRRKGLETVLRSLSLAPGSPHLIVVGGDDPQPYLRLARSLGVGEHVRFVGRSSEVFGYFAASDVLVLPTQYEPFGLVVVEALASGLPVIVSSVCGITSYLRDGLDALLLPNPCDTALLAHLTGAVQTQPALARQLSQNGLKAATQFDWERVVERTLDFYQLILERKRLNSSSRDVTRGASK